MIGYISDSLKYLSNKFLENSGRWDPILSVYYLTYRCDFRCPYCSDGLGIPYHKLPSDDVSGETALSVLANIRKYTNYVVITGGEPLRHPDFSYVIKHLPKLGFKNVVLTTNGYEVDTFLPEIAQSVHSLIFSIDTMNHNKADKWHGIGPGSFDKILHNIKLADEYRGKQFKIFISSVVTPDNIEDLYQVYNFCKEKNFMFAAAPQLVGVKAHKLLNENAEYTDFFNFLLEEKINGGLVYGTVPYLKYMRDLKKFNCFPFTMLVLSPEGNVYYPCLEIGKKAGNILDGFTLHQLKDEGIKQYGCAPDCGTQCHSACALGFALILKNPFLIISEAYYSVKSNINLA